MEFEKEKDFMNLNNREMYNGQWKNDRMNGFGYFLTEDGNQFMENGKMIYQEPGKNGIGFLLFFHKYNIHFLSFLFCNLLIFIIYTKKS